MHNLWNRVQYGSCSPLVAFYRTAARAWAVIQRCWLAFYYEYFISHRDALPLSLSLLIFLLFLHFIPLETWQNKCSIQHFGAKYTDMAWLHRGLFRFAHIKSHRIDSCVMCTKCFCRRNEYSNKWWWSKYSVEYKQPADVNSHPMLSFSFLDTFTLCTYSLQLCATSRGVDWM